MNSGQYYYTQLYDYLPKQTFDGIVNKYQLDKYVKTITLRNQLLVMMYEQLSRCDSLRKVICIINAIKKKSVHLGICNGHIMLSDVAYVKANQDYRIFEEFAYHMIGPIDERGLTGCSNCMVFYAFDSTTIDPDNCLYYNTH